MRFDETNPKYRFDQRQTMSPLEVEQMISDHKEDMRVRLNESWGKLKDYTKGEDDRYLYEAGVKKRDETKKKGSKFPLVVFIVGLVLLLICAALHFVMGCIGAFFGIVLALGIYALKNANDIQSETLVQQKKAGPIIMILIGLAGVVPFFLSFFIGTGYAVGIFAILLFGAVGGYCVYSAFWKLFAKKIKYKDTVNGTCIGYARYVDSHTNDESHVTRYFVCCSPVFEYYYEGRQYKAMYDVIDARASSDIFCGSTNELFIDPKDPEAVYHETKKGVVGSFLIGLLCLAIAFGMGFATATGHIGEVETNSGSSSSSSESSGSFPIFEIFKTLKTMKGGDIKDKTVDREAPKGEEWYIEEVPVSETEMNDDKSRAYIYFADEDFKTFEVTDTDTYNPCGKNPICFYTIDEDALEAGEAYKDVFMYRDSRTFTYVGDHEAYD